MNQITECGYGVKLLNGSTVDQFTGRCGVHTAETTQNIHDNDTCEVYIYNDCMPETFKYNVITTNKKWNIETCENITIKQSSYMSMEADSL